MKCYKVFMLIALMSTLALGGTAYAQTHLASVRSEPGPQQGQRHRSSGNFSTQGAPGGTRNLCWNISGNSSAGRISFDVMRDISAGTDPVIFSGLRNGSRTGYYSSRSLYIANPREAGGHSFVVSVATC
jgi:hypothetical protein